MFCCGYSKRATGNIKAGRYQQQTKGVWGHQLDASRGKGKFHREFQLEKTDINTCRMILSRTGLCTGVLVTIGSCGWWWCAIPAGNLLWMSDVLFICVCSQVLRCVASARSSSQWPCCEGRFLSPFYSWKIEAQRALIAFEELSAVWQSCFLTA